MVWGVKKGRRDTERERTRLTLSVRDGLESKAHQEGKISHGEAEQYARYERSYLGATC